MASQLYNEHIKRIHYGAYYIICTPRKRNRITFDHIKKYDLEQRWDTYVSYDWKLRELIKPKLSRVCNLCYKLAKARATKKVNATQRSKKAEIIRLLHEINKDIKNFRK